MPPPRIRIRPSPATLLRPNTTARSPHFFTQRSQPQRAHYNVSTLLSRLRLKHSSAAPSALSQTTSIVKLTVKILLVAHVFIAYVATVGPTDGISMVPTIPHSFTSHPWIFVSRLHRHGRNIAVGDVVTYSSPRQAAMLGCKRVVGMPGDFVAVVSGARVDEDVEKSADEGDWANVKEELVRVPEGHCWLAGDNLEWSRDSRVFGAVPLNLVRGKAQAVVWPPSAWKMLGGEEGLRDVKEGVEHEPIVSR